MADDNTPTDDKPQDPPDAQGKNAGGNDSGAGTDTADKTPVDEKKFTQAEVEEMFKKRLSKAVKSELRKLTDGKDPDDKPDANELQRRAEDAETRARALEAKDELFDFVDNPRNKVGLKPESRKLFWKLAKDELEYDDEGKPTNLKEVVSGLKEEAPALFMAAGSADAGRGRQTPANVNMNQLIRNAAGRQ